MVSPRLVKNLSSDALARSRASASRPVPMVAAFSVGDAIALEVLVAHVVHGVGGRHEISAGTDRVDDVEGQMLRVHLNAFEHLAAHPDDFVVDDVLFVGNRQHGFEHTGAVVQ